MKTEIKYAPPEVRGEIAERITNDVVNALASITTRGRKFIVNDTLWYAVQRGKATPTVVNSAHFITGRLQGFLRDEAGWTTDCDVEGQEIDGYITLEVDKGMVLEKEGLLQILESGWSKLGREPDELFSELYQYYGVRSAYLLGSNLIPFRTLFKMGNGRTEFRVGLEFETGNIASSFRAFSKLNSLFRQNMIDAGVFITSKNKKATACRIWPASNRNGSFEELASRDYRRNISLPMFEVSFEPDGVDKAAPYLGSDGTTYEPTDTGVVKALEGAEYRVFRGERNLEILLPTAPQ